MCIYWGYICIFISNMKFPSLILWLEGLCTDADDTHNYARRTNHDYIGSFGRIPNEPKILKINWEKSSAVNMACICESYTHIIYNHVRNAILPTRPQSSRVYERTLNTFLQQKILKSIRTIRCIIFILVIILFYRIYNLFTKMKYVQRYSMFHGIRKTK